MSDPQRPTTVIVGATGVGVTQRELFAASAGTSAAAYEVTDLTAAAQLAL